MDNKGCIASCGANDNIYKFEFNNTCYDECPGNLKLILNENKCTESCSEHINNKFEYNSTCYEECPNNLKLINNTNKCFDSCFSETTF